MARDLTVSGSHPLGGRSTGLPAQVKDWVQGLTSQGGWEEVGQGWQAAEAELQFSGCARSWRAVLLRRRVESRQRARGQALKRNQRELALPELVLGEQERYEFAVLATSLALEPLALAQLYWDRADVENLLDELKNQLGLGRFLTRALKRTRIMVCLNALFYNWWSLFVRLIDPESRREARTSRSLMMDGVGRVLKHSRQTTLLPTIAHSATGGL